MYVLHTSLILKLSYWNEIINYCIDLNVSASSTRYIDLRMCCKIEKELSKTVGHKNFKTDNESLSAIEMIDKSQTSNITTVF